MVIVYCRGRKSCAIYVHDNINNAMVIVLTGPLNMLRDLLFYVPSCFITALLLLPEFVAWRNPVVTLLRLPSKSWSSLPSSYSPFPPQICQMSSIVNITRVQAWRPYARLASAEDIIGLDCDLQYCIPARSPQSSANPFEDSCLPPPAILLFIYSYLLYLSYIGKSNI
jgi:hypothetical protein